jgi:hypothetical protein
MKAIDIILANGRKGATILGDNGIQVMTTDGGTVEFSIGSTYTEDMLVTYMNSSGETVEESYPAQESMLRVYTVDALGNSPITVKKISVASFPPYGKNMIAVFGDLLIENDSFVKELRSMFLTTDASVILRKSAIESFSWDGSNYGGAKCCREIVFSDCNSITELALGGDVGLSNVVTIEKCKNLSSIFLPGAKQESFVKIDNCRSLASIYIPVVNLQLSALPLIENIKLFKSSFTPSQESLSSIAEEVLVAIQNSTKQGGALTTDYQELFDILPSSLPNGWTLVFED